MITVITISNNDYYNTSVYAECFRGAWRFLHREGMK